MYINLFQLITVFENKRVYQTFAARIGRFQSTFFPYCVQWNNLDGDLRDMTSLSSFNSALLKFIRPKLNPFTTYTTPRVILLNSLRVGFSHLREHKFRHNFPYIINPFCDCRTNAIETTKHLLHCPILFSQRKTLFDNLHKKSISLFPYNEFYLLKILLYGNVILGPF